MAGGGREAQTFKHNKYKGMDQPEQLEEVDYCDDGFNEEETVSEIRNKYRHLRRLADGASQPFMKPHSPDEFFVDVYPEFLNYFSRGQLQHLEKLFLMSDQDRDGQLNKFEVKYWMEKQGNPISQPEVKEIFKVADENKDGLLSFREFLIFCQRIELKGIPSERGIQIQGMVEDPTGQGAKYPPRPPCEDGVGKISTKLKSFTKVQANIGGAVAFFESEIAKEVESCERGRQTYDAVMEQKRGAHRKEDSKPFKDFTPAPQRYRTSLHMEIQENRPDYEQRFRTSLTMPNNNQSELQQPSLSHNRQYYQDHQRASVPEKYLDFKSKDKKVLPTTWNAETAKNTYKPSLPFVSQINQTRQNQLKPTNFENRKKFPATGTKVGQRKYQEMPPRSSDPFANENRYSKSPPSSASNETQVIYVSSGDEQKPSDIKLHSGFSGPNIPVPPPLPLPPPPQSTSNKKENDPAKNDEAKEEVPPSQRWWNFW